jgi:hypothetical protein
MRVVGGGAHTSKTMMLSELSIAIAEGTAFDNGTFREMAMNDNVLGKRSDAAKVSTLDKLELLYGLKQRPGMLQAMLAIWQRSAAKPMIAALAAVARDPLFRATARAMLEASVGEAINSHEFRAVLNTAMPDRFSDTTMAALSERCASSWAQGGYLSSGSKKRRQRAQPDRYAAAFAAFLAISAGFKGRAIIDSPWLDLLDVETESRLSLLRQAEADDLIRLRSAGHVFDIELRGELARIDEGVMEKRGTLI